MWENNGLKLQNQLEFLAFIQVVDVTINMTQDLNPSSCEQSVGVLLS